MPDDHLWAQPATGQWQHRWDNGARPAQLAVPGRRPGQKPAATTVGWRRAPAVQTAWGLHEQIGRCSARPGQLTRRSQPRAGRRARLREPITFGRMRLARVMVQVRFMQEAVRRWLWRRCRRSSRWRPAGSCLVTVFPVGARRRRAS